MKHHLSRRTRNTVSTCKAFLAFVRIWNSRELKSTNEMPNNSKILPIWNYSLVHVRACAHRVAIPENKFLTEDLNQVVTPRTLLPTSSDNLNWFGTRVITKAKCVKCAQGCRKFPRSLVGSHVQSLTCTPCRRTYKRIVFRMGRLQMMCVWRSHGEVTVLLAKVTCSCTSPYALGSRIILPFRIFSRSVAQWCKHCQ